MKILYYNLKNFLKDVAEDQRIPMVDKKIILVLIGLTISPIDFIPDWIPFYGLIDDLLMLALVMDYFFNVIDQSILLSHYPWGMKSFARIKRIAGIFSFFVPNFIADNLWKYVKEPF